MSRIFIINDFSPSRPWLFHFLRSQKELFKQSNLALAPLSKWTSSPFPSHYSFWLPVQDGAPISSSLASSWEVTAGFIAKGMDVVFFNPFLRPECHEFFRHCLVDKTSASPGDVHNLCIIGRPLLMFEQRYREYGIMKTEAARYLAEQYGRLPELIKAMHSAHCHVRLEANMQPYARAAANDALAEKVFNFLGIEKNWKRPQPPVHPLFFESHPARRLARAREVQSNAWPDIDEKNYQDALNLLDARLGTDIYTPLEIRKELEANNADSFARLAELLDIDRAFLSAPEIYLEQEETASDSSITPAHAKEFAALLSNRNRAALHMRFVNDAMLLDEEQKILDEKLEDYRGNFVRMDSVEPPVELTVLTMTYNHEKYIAECMESVLKQQTDFPVRHLVLDHNSTDGTAAIVAEYAGKYSTIRPILLSSHIYSQNVSGLFSRCHSKYAALCDGDDYFTEPLKLQKQVDFLESNPSFGLCFHPVCAVFENGDPPVIFPPLANLPKRQKMEFYLADLMKNNFIQTNSVVYRWRFSDGLPGWFRADLCPGDWYWHMLHAETGKIGFIPEIMSVYRRHASAIYAAALSSSVELRRTMGLAELRAYKAYNEHFKDRYFRPLSALGVRVFLDFLNLAVNENDWSLLEQAKEDYPRIAVEFERTLSALKRAGRTPPGISAEKMALFYAAN